MGKTMMSVSVLVMVLCSAGQVGAKSPLPSMPEPPLAIAKPSEPPRIYRNTDLRNVDVARLASVARSLGQEGNNREAAQLQYWVIKKSDNGRYDLACFLALAREKDAAFYWLQQAAISDGANAEWAQEDSDLAMLREDPRWEKVAKFLKTCNSAWAESGLHQTTLVLPRRYRRGTPIGVVIGLHGRGSEPGRFVDKDVQPFADELRMAFLGVSGTIPQGRSSFSWTEDAVKDAQQIRRALKEVADRVTIDPGRLVLYGFSQGGIAAFEVAFVNPKEFRGAISLSPGGNFMPPFEGFKPVEDHKVQGYVYLCGGGELEGNLFLTREFAKVAREAGARVELIMDPKQSTHSFPADFADTFTKRVRFVLDER